MNKISSVLGILALMLVIALAMPMMASHRSLSAQGSDAYALVQLPKGATGEALKTILGSACNVFDATGDGIRTYAVIGCTAAQLNSLASKKYTVIEQRSGNEEECLTYLFQKLDLLVPPRIGHHSIGGPDKYGYYLIDSTERGGPRYSWVEISGTGTEIGIRCDDCHKYPFNIGFTFNFYGANYTRAAIQSNGGIAFQNKYLQFWNQPITRATYNNLNTFIAPFWDDLATYNRGRIYYQTLQTRRSRGQRIFVVEWYNVPRCCESKGVATFEAILFEGSNEILMQYKDVDFDARYANWGKGATVGIQQNSTNGLQHSFNSPVIKDELAILFTPKHPRYSPLLQGQQE